MKNKTVAELLQETAELHEKLKSTPEMELLDHLAQSVKKFEGEITHLVRVAAALPQSLVPQVVKSFADVHSALSAQIDIRREQLLQAEREAAGSAD